MTIWLPLKLHSIAISLVNVAAILEELQNFQQKSGKIVRKKLLLAVKKSQKTINLSILLPKKFNCKLYWVPEFILLNRNINDKGWWWVLWSGARTWNTSQSVESVLTPCLVQHATISSLTMSHYWGRRHAWDCLPPASVWPGSQEGKYQNWETGEIWVLYKQKFFSPIICTSPPVLLSFHRDSAWNISNEEKPWIK